MKKLSETYKELGIAFTFPIEIKDSNGNETYFEASDGFWYKREYDVNGSKTYKKSATGWSKHEYDTKGNKTYYEDSDCVWWKREYDTNDNVTYFGTDTGFWSKHEYDANGNQTYYENNEGLKQGTPRSQSRDGKVVEIDGLKYELKLTN